jgi:hypothetical protein
MPRFALALLTASALVLMAPTAFAQDDDAGESAMLARINELRAAQGLSPLARDGQLDQAARRHSHDMADHQQLMHVSDTTGTPADRVHAAGLAIDEIAENVAMHSDTAQAEATLEASPPHLANMMNPRFTHVGIAAILHGDGVYVTQVFGRIEAAPSAPPPEVATVPALPPPSVATPPTTTTDVTPAPTTATITVAPPVTSIPSASGAAVVVPPSSSGVVTVPPPRPGVAGYWVCGSGRWWYYPIPAGATGGSQLQPDLSVSGPPPGYGTLACGSGAYAVSPRPMAPPPTTTVVPIGPRGPSYGTPVIVEPGLVIGPWGGGVRVEVAPAPMYAPAPVYVTPPRVYGRPRGRWRRYR